MKGDLAMQNQRQLFAQNLRRRRTELHMSQVKLAEKISYTGKAVSKWESGLVLPPAEVLPSIANALDTDLNTLFDFREKASYFLGIDGGGTKTKFMLTDDGGNILKAVSLGPCNPVSTGLDISVNILREGIKKVCGNIPHGKISVFAGIAGCGVGQNAASIEASFKYMGFSRFKVSHDADNIISAALENRDGIIAILGTGSVIFAVEDGERRQIGGYGHLIGDVFSGTEFGRACLESVLYDIDTGSKHTAMTSAVLEKAAKPISEIVADIYKNGKDYIAGFAEILFECAKKGDAAALEILGRNTEKLADMLNCALGSFCEGHEKVPVVLAGGITNYSSCFLPALNQKTLSGRKSSVTVLDRDPVIGAVLLAGAKKVEEK